jgi:cyclase
MVDGIKRGGAAAIAAASIFHFTERTPKEAKHFMSENGILTRV